MTTARTAVEQVTTWLAVEPLDTIMVRDGRQFDAGDAGAATAVAPPPSTLGGAVGAALGEGASGGHRADELVGPFLAVAGDPRFPTPQDITLDDDADVHRLAARPAHPDERTDLSGSLSHLLVGPGDPVGGYLDTDGLTDWLSGDGELAPGHSARPAWWRERLVGAPWYGERRVGLARRVEGEFADTADPGMLYAATHLRPVEDMGFVVGCVASGPLAVVDDLVPLGGRGRLATVRVCDPPELPAMPRDFPDGRVAVCLATPALLGDVRWQPAGARLCAMALGGPQTVATASPREGLWRTRRLRWAVPAGTVYYLDFGSAEAAGAWARRHHGRLLPGQIGEPIVHAGFGTCLVGRWMA
ncbi:MAG TPA: type III-B CRISPR module-associated Cmr3 family protein [Pseudonocardiaceae bacterium]|nr:type III-B CRISPR module-associated Cmr3 family protein [Pseudonocardiaceae bacterium]